MWPQKKKKVRVAPPTPPSTPESTTYKMLLPKAGSDSITLLVPFQPAEIIPGFIVEDEAGLPTCNPVMGDSVVASEANLGVPGVFGVTISWSISGPRAIQVVVNNYIG